MIINPAFDKIPKRFFDTLFGLFHIVIRHTLQSGPGSRSRPRPKPSENADYRPLKKANPTAKFTV